METIGEYLKVINDNIISFMIVLLIFGSIVYGTFYLLKMLVKKIIKIYKNNLKNK